MLGETNISNWQPMSTSEREEISIIDYLYRFGFRGWRVRRTGVEYIEPPVCLVAGGMFMMGCDENETVAQSNEKPQYRIQVGAFAIGKYPVTVEEYKYYLKANPGVSAHPITRFPSM